MARVIVVGSSNTDMTVRLPSLPRPGETVLGGTFAVSAGGKGANQAVAARRAGGDVVFITAVGDDDLGRRALVGYRQEGIDVSYIKVVPGVASGVALIYVGEAGENMIGVASGANLELKGEDIDALPDSLFQPGDVLLISMEIPAETAVRAMERGKREGMSVVINPAPSTHLDSATIIRMLSTATMITPNEGEALEMLRKTDPGSADGTRCFESLQDLGSATVGMTMGSRGCRVATRDGLDEIVLPPRVDAVDTVGAGDTFNGALAVALAEGRPLLDAVRWASAAAALAVTRPGAQAACPTRDEIDRLASGLI